ncbi:MAG: 2-oxo-4-hydroxy-4-carboxy-5-ureidoimidazoline decarboxylase [Segetibacter sp.]|nr:2-oxo-4-hydroxy-4-carboxy-5-ureidoimidazoline decarboxylase [Segetibacter sp.]
MTIADFDHLPIDQKRELLQKCCGSKAWIDKMLVAPPAEDLVDLLETAEEKWYECSEKDWLEAFEHHPKIGDINSLKKKYSNTVAWASNEQWGVNVASEEILHALAKGNDDYEKKFGYIFIVCATGKSAGEMLEILQSRLANNPDDEIKIAAEEQNKITKLRLEKLFD